MLVAAWAWDETIERSNIGAHPLVGHEFRSRKHGYVEHLLLHMGCLTLGRARSQVSHADGFVVGFGDGGVSQKQRSARRDWLLVGMEW